MIRSVNRLLKSAIHYALGKLGYRLIKSGENAPLGGAPRRVPFPARFDWHEDSVLTHSNVRSALEFYESLCCDDEAEPDILSRSGGQLLD